jgi:hypothetical protein
MNPTFQPIQVRRTLHRQVMVIARTRIEGTWKAYCFPVPGRNHDEEETLWREHGSQVRERVARALFPEFDSLRYSD